MPPVPEDAFEKFVTQRKEALQRIARHTRGEHDLDDVKNEAWVMAGGLKTADGAPLDLTNAACQERLLSYLYQHLVRYTEQNVRRAVRLDRAPPGHDQDDDVHPLARMLVSDEGRDPLSQLLDREAALAREVALDAHGSLAAAYVRLLHHFDNRMSAVADHLLISRSYAYRRCAQARWLATRLSHIPVPTDSGPHVPGPWRNFRLCRAPVQLAFDFDEELPFELPAR